MLTAMTVLSANVDDASLTCENGRMTVDEPIILFTREGCHLCEVAAQMLERAGISVQEVDVDADPELEERYGIRVPVLLRPDSGQQLFFPFGEEQVLSFIRRSP
jgi:hypothetical protein